MTPTIFTFKNYRFFFFSREETRKHVHVSCGDGEAKFWLEPEIELATNYHLSTKQLREIELFIRENQDEIINQWDQTSAAEVVGISKFGIWVYVAGKEFFLPYEDFPWFLDAKVSSVYNLTFHNEFHLRWPELDIDIDTRSMECPDDYPLVYR